MTKYKKPYLIWHFMGKLRGKEFETFEDLETFSKKLIAAGLSPMVPADCPTPYDNG